MSTVTNRTSGFSSDEQASHTTASFIPAGSSVAVLTFSSLVPGQTSSSVPVVSGQGRVWTKLRAVSPINNNGTDSVLYVYIGTGAGSEGSVTITHDVNPSIGCSWIIDEITDCDLVDPVVQHNGAVGTTGSASVTLGAFSSSSNGTYASGAAVNDITAVGSGFTQLVDFAGAFGASHTSQWRADNDTTADFTISGDDFWGIIAFEIAEPSVSNSYALDAESGNYVLTGQTINLLAGGLIIAEFGSYSLIGSDAARDIAMNASPGSYEVDGQDADLLGLFTLIAESGQYDLLGQAASLIASFAASIAKPRRLSRFYGFRLSR